MCVEENDIPFNLNREYVEKYVVNRGARERGSKTYQRHRLRERTKDRVTERQRQRKGKRDRDGNREIMKRTKEGR
jgi:hypothetical protein